MNLLHHRRAKSNKWTVGPGDEPLENPERQQLCARNRGTLRLFVYKMNESANRKVEKGARLTTAFADDRKELPREVFEPRALTHRVCFERRFPATQPLSQQYYDDHQDDMRRPCAIFEFRYRSKRKSEMRPPNLSVFSDWECLC